MTGPGAAGRLGRAWPGPLAVLATAAVVALASAGIVAQVRHEVVSEDNTLTSGVIEVGPGLAVALAVAGSCDGVDWSSGPVPALLVADVDLADGEWEHVGATLCVHNETDVDLALTAAARNVTDLEDGECAPGEAAAGDADCAAGEAGELSQVTTLGWEAVRTPGGGRSDCSGSDASAFATSAAGASLGAIAAGEVCRFRSVAGLDGAVAPELAQTDQLRWDAVLTGDAGDGA